MRLSRVYCVIHEQVQILSFQPELCTISIPCQALRKVQLGWAAHVAIVVFEVDLERRVNPRRVVCLLQLDEVVERCFRYVLAAKLAKAWWKKFHSSLWRYSGDGKVMALRALNSGSRGVGRRRSLESFSTTCGTWSAGYEGDYATADDDAISSNFDDGVEVKRCCNPKTDGIKDTKLCLRLRVMISLFTNPSTDDSVVPIRERT